MGLLKYIEMNGVGEVKLTSRYLSELEDNILDRTEGICYEGGPSHVSKDIKLEQQTHSDGETRQLPELSSCSKRRKVVEASADVVVVSSSSAKSESKEEKDDAGGRSSQTRTPQTMVSKCKIRKQIVFSESDESDDDDMAMDAPKIDLHGLDAGRLEQVVESIPSILRWQEKKAKKETHLRKRISRYRLSLTLEHDKNVKLVKKVKKLKNSKRSTLVKGREAIRMLAKKTREHAKETEALRKELDDARAEGEEKLKVATCELKHERELVDKLTGDRKWLIEEGFEYVIKRLLGSREFFQPLMVMESKVWSMGAHDGVVEGYSRCQDGVALEALGIYKPEAETEVIKAADELKQMRFPYVVALSQCANRTLDELKSLEPEAMEDEDK